LTSIPQDKQRGATSAEVDASPLCFELIIYGV